MKTLGGLGVFLALAVALGLMRWLPDQSFAQAAPADAVLFAAVLTPFVATWVMPTWLSLLIYPLGVLGLLCGAGVLGQAFIPVPPAPESYGCGLAYLGALFASVAGVAIGLIGRAIGLASGLKSGVLTYLVQLLPLSPILLLFSR